jgi:hypothetical protein
MPSKRYELPSSRRVSASLNDCVGGQARTNRNQKGASNPYTHDCHMTAIKAEANRELLHQFTANGRGHFRKPFVAGRRARSSLVLRMCLALAGLPEGDGEQ